MSKRKQVIFFLHFGKDSNNNPIVHSDFIRLCEVLTKQPQIEQTETKLEIARQVDMFNQASNEDTNIQLWDLCDSDINMLYKKAKKFEKHGYQVSINFSQTRGFHEPRNFALLKALIEDSKTLGKWDFVRFCNHPDLIQAVYDKSVYYQAFLDHLAESHVHNISAVQTYNLQTGQPDFRTQFMRIFKQIADQQETLQQELKKSPMSLSMEHKHSQSSLPPSSLHTTRITTSGKGIVVKPTIGSKAFGVLYIEYNTKTGVYTVNRRSAKDKTSKPKDKAYIPAKSWITEQYCTEDQLFKLLQDMFQGATLMVQPNMAYAVEYSAVFIGGQCVGMVKKNHPDTDIDFQRQLQARFESFPRLGKRSPTYRPLCPTAYNHEAFNNFEDRLPTNQFIPLANCPHHLVEAVNSLNTLLRSCLETDSSRFMEYGNYRIDFLDPLGALGLRSPIAFFELEAVCARLSFLEQQLIEYLALTYQGKHLPELQDGQTSETKTSTTSTDTYAQKPQEVFHCPELCGLLQTSSSMERRRPEPHQDQPMQSRPDLHSLHPKTQLTQSTYDASTLNPTWTQSDGVRLFQT